MAHANDIEIDRNFAFFERNVTRYMPEHAGEYALLKDEAVIDFFRSAIEAEMAGDDRFADGLFSVQEVTNEPVDLGFFSYALSPGNAA